MPTSPTRRAVLAALSASAAAGLAGCATPWGRLRVQPLGGDPAPTTPPPGPDELARRAAVSAVSAVLAQVGDLPAPLAGPLRTALAEQLVALGVTAPSASGSATSTASTPAPSSTTSSPSGSPAASNGSSPRPAQQAAQQSAQQSAQRVVGLLDDAAARASADLAAVAGGTARLLACLSAGLDVAAGWTRAGLGQQPGAGGTSPSWSPSSSPSSTSSPGAASGARGASGAPTAAAGSGEQRALVEALAVEEAAQYGYGVVAVRLSGAQRDAAVRALAAHTDLVELLRHDLLAQGAAPPAPAPAWVLPSPVVDAAGAVALAQRLEGASAAAWADLVAAAARERRSAAAAQLQLAAQRWQQWRSAAAAPGLVALPGLSGR